MDTRNDPIEFSVDDQLGRASTAKVFSRALLANPRRPMVAAVFGPWGSGKTSFANLLSAELRTAGTRCSWFNPWQFTNVEALTIAFFDLLASNLTPTDEHDAETIREYFFSYGETISSLALLPSGPMFTGRANRAASKGLRPKGLLTSPTVQEQRDRLIHLYAANPKPVIVFIDDIDRLFANEIRLLIQLVKSNADFPNLKFVLLFQKETVEAALKTDGQSGAEFLEKIIEVPIELPLIRGPRYINDLLKEVADIFGDLADLSERDGDRWQHLLNRGVVDKFTTLRQKNRLIDRLHLHKWNIESGQGLNINLVDLLAIEILRAIDYELYTAIRKVGPMFTEVGDEVRAILYGSSDGAAYFADILSETGGGDHEKGKQILFDLFPCFGESAGSNDALEDEREFRICRRKHFPKYFFEGLLPDELSKAGRRRLEHAAIRGEGLFELLCAFEEQELLFECLEYLHALAVRIPKEHWTTVACDLGRISDKYGRRQGVGIERSIARTAEAVLRQMLETAPQRDRSFVLVVLASQPEAIQLSTLMIAADDSGVTDRTLKSVRRDIAKEIESAAASGLLEQLEQYGRLLLCWHNWSPTAASRYARSIAMDPARFTHFARSVAQYSREQAGIRQVSRARYLGAASGVLQFLVPAVAIKCTREALAALAGHKDEEFLKSLFEELSQPLSLTLVTHAVSSDEMSEVVGES